MMMRKARKICSRMRRDELIVVDDLMTFRSICEIKVIDVVEL